MDAQPTVTPLAPSKGSRSFLYIVVPANEKQYKIGKANDPWVRWHALNIRPDPTRSCLVQGPTAMVFRLEKALHFMLEPYRTRMDHAPSGNTEWFHLESLPKALEAIDRLLGTHHSFQRSVWPDEPSIRPSTRETYRPDETAASLRRSIDAALPHWERFLDVMQSADSLVQIVPRETAGEVFDLPLRAIFSGLPAHGDKSCLNLCHQAFNHFVYASSRFGYRFVTDIEWTTRDSDSSMIIASDFRLLGSLLTRLERFGVHHSAMLRFATRLEAFVTNRGYPGTAPIREARSYHV